MLRVEPINGADPIAEHVSVVSHHTKALQAVFKVKK